VSSTANTNQIIGVIGLNHKTAPIEVREALSFNDEQATLALNRFSERFPEAEAVLLSTCNRVEFYCTCRADLWADGQLVTDFLAQMRELSVEAFSDHLYSHVGDAAIKHLLTVTSSLDSLVVGEPQIVTQVKEAYKRASSLGATGKVFNKM
jgi:glutamyl-tRNA reductase